MKLSSLSSFEFKNEWRHASIRPDTTLQNLLSTFFAEIKLNSKNIEFLNFLCLIDMCRKETGLVSFGGTISYWLCLYTGASVALLDALHYFVTSLNYRRYQSQFQHLVN